MYGNSQFGGNYGGSPMQRGGSPLANMPQANNQNMPFGGQGGYPNQMNPKMGINGMGHPGMNNMNGLGGMGMPGQFGNHNMANPNLQRPMGPGADKENGMNSYGLAPQGNNLGLRGGLNPQGMMQGQNGMRPGQNYPGMGQQQQQPNMNYQGMNGMGQLGVPGQQPGMSGTQGRFGLGGNQMSPGRYGQNPMSPGRYGQPGLDQSGTNPNAYGQTPNIAGHANPGFNGRLGGKNIPGLNLGNGQENPALSPSRYDPYSANGQEGMSQQPFSPSRHPQGYPGAQPQQDINLRDRLGNYDQQRPNMTGLRDRYAGALGQGQQPSAPGLSNHDGAFSPSRYASPGHAAEPQSLPLQQRAGLGQQPQIPPQNGQLYNRQNPQDNYIGSPVKRFGQEQPFNQSGAYSHPNSQAPLRNQGPPVQDQQNQLQQQQPNYDAQMNRSHVPLNERINPNYNQGTFSPNKQNYQPTQQYLPQTEQGRRFGSPMPEDNDYNSVGTNYDQADHQNQDAGFNGQAGFQHQPRFVRSQPRAGQNQLSPINAHQPLNTESRLINQGQQQRDRNFANITPKKLNYNGYSVPNKREFRDFTSIGAIDLVENGMGFELNGGVFAYGGDKRGYLERITTQEYQGRFEKGWESYINNSAKEIAFVDEVLATGGRGQGETVEIPKDYSSKIFFFEI